MTSLVVLIETVVIVALVWRLARHAESAEATQARIAVIATLLAAQALVLDRFVLRVLPALWRAGQGTPPGIVWLTQATRTALLVPAFVLWCRRASRSRAGRWGETSFTTPSFPAGGWSWRWATCRERACRPP